MHGQPNIKITKQICEHVINVQYVVQRVGGIDRGFNVTAC